MLHRCDGAVVCDIVGHVAGDRLDLGHGVAHGDSRLDRSEHAQVVTRIAEAKGARVAGATQVFQRSRHAHALVDALGAQLAILTTGVAQLKLAIDKAIIVGTPCPRADGRRRASPRRCAPQKCRSETTAQRPRVPGQK